MSFQNQSSLFSRWVYPEKNLPLYTEILKELHLPPLIAEILSARGFQDLQEIRDYLYAKLPQLFAPELFPDMDKAVARILSAIEKKEQILIYGDKDVDGMSAAALLTEFLRSLGARVHFTLPHCISIQKTLLQDALVFARKHQCSLIITVDCGVSAAKEIQELISEGIDVIITDHHEPTSKIPHCIATLNPKLIHSTYPNRDLTGVGVAFKLAHAITNQLAEIGSLPSTAIDLKKYLDLVALGTIADMGSLKGENRILVRYGLEQMKKKERVGLAKLFELSELEQSTPSPTHIASKIAPRLNSLGRIADPIKGVELLLSQDSKSALELAKLLDLNNVERQRIERHAFEEIEQILIQNPQLLEHRAIFLYSENWHPGIIPILAARIAKQYSRPTLIISLEEGIGKGSIRTIPEFPLLTLLKEQEHLLLNYGGHDFAAGFTIQKENIPLLKKHFLETTERILKEQDLILKLHLDAKVQFEDLTFDFLESLKFLEPFGNENPPPLLYADVVQVWPPKLVGKDHLKLFLEQKDRMLEAIAFGMAHREAELRQKNLELRIAFTPQVNLFLKKASIQLQIKDFQRFPS